MANLSDHDEAIRFTDSKVWEHNPCRASRLVRAVQLSSEVINNSTTQVTIAFATLMGVMYSIFRIDQAGPFSLVKDIIALATSGIFVSLAGFLVALILASFWHLDSVYGRKWTYAANLFNQIVLHDCKRNSTRHHIFYASLMIDLLALNLWADPVFRRFFREEFVYTLGKVYPDTKDIMISKLVDSEMTKSEAYRILSSYMGSLEEKADKEQLQIDNDEKTKEEENLRREAHITRALDSYEKDQMRGTLFSRIFGRKVS